MLGYAPDFHLRTEDGSDRREVPAVTDRLEKLATLRGELQERWRTAVERQAKYYNAKHIPKTLKEGSLVALSTRNLRLKVPNKKLAPKFIGPFRVLAAVGSQAYRISLPTQYERLHNVFPISLLEPWNPREGEYPENYLQMPELEDDDQWAVEEIKDERRIGGETQFYVKWEGWPSEYNQWVNEEDMQAPRAIAKFRKQATKTKLPSHRTEPPTQSNTGTERVEPTPAPKRKRGRPRKMD